MAGRLISQFSRLHVKCRTQVPSKYIADEGQMRLGVPDDKVPWDVSWPEYHPPAFTMQIVLQRPVWADPSIRDNLKFNDIDGSVDRRSHLGVYTLDSDHSPLNPVGRTGLKGRGILGKWGPNHAADPIVTRWKRNEDGEVVINEVSEKPILQFVSVLRKDTGEWALPGGMVDPGENLNLTLKREFSEEAMNSLELEESEREAVKKQVDELFSHGVQIYKGYVDDPRNTDNAWMETVAYNFHDETGKSVGAFRLQAGDDAVGVKWIDVNSNLRLYASHLDFIKQAADSLGAHW